MVSRLFDFFIFSSLFIAGCAVIMVYQVNDIFQVHNTSQPYLWFVFFSTICSYNFHWYFTPHSVSENSRILWTQQHKRLHLLLIIVSITGAFLFFLQLIEYWLWISLSIILTFLYSAPKLPFRPAYFLRKIAVGKTIFLAMVWMYVTTILPIILSAEQWELPHSLFSTDAFFSYMPFVSYSIFVIVSRTKEKGLKA